MPIAKPSEPAVIDRARGCLIGLAVGDALGAAVEFRSPGTFPPVTGYRDGGPHGLPPGGWTDDTSMALALGDSIGLANQESNAAGWDLDDQAGRYVRWYQSGMYSVTGRCFDIGIQTSDALHRFESTGDARTAGPTDDQQSGNGSIMRLAPVPIAGRHLFPDHIGELATLAAESSLPTHGSEQCQSACRLMAVQLAALIGGESKDAVLAADWPARVELERTAPLHPLIAEIANGSFRRRQPPEIVGSGWVVRSLEAALWAIDRSDNFADAVLAAVNLGDDADTTGAVCGQYAGAIYGESGIPPEWRDGLMRRDLIDPVLDRLLGVELRLP